MNECVALGGRQSQGKHAVLEEKSNSVPFCPPQILARAELGLNLGFYSERLPTNHLSHGPANPVSSNIN